MEGVGSVGKELMYDIESKKDVWRDNLDEQDTKVRSKTAIEN